MKEITLTKAFALLEQASAVIINDDVLVYPSLDQITGDENNEWMNLSWENDAQEYSMKFDEGQNNSVFGKSPRIENNKLILIDSEGDEVALTLLESKEMSLEEKPKTWTLCFLLKESKHESFAEAFKAMYGRIMEEPDLTTQLLETAIWVQPIDGSPIFFYAAKDIAYAEGLLKDGKPTW